MSLHLIFVCVCVLSSACVFVSASHSDSRCGVFHTTKLFDSGFPKVSEDIFQFFGLLLFLSLQKGVVDYFFNLARKFFVFSKNPERQHTHTQKTITTRRRRRRKNPTLVCLGGHCCVLLLTLFSFFFLIFEKCFNQRKERKDIVEFAYFSISFFQFGWPNLSIRGKQISWDQISIRFFQLVLFRTVSRELV